MARKKQQDISTEYADHKEQAGQRQQEQSKKGRDIAPIPRPTSAARRRRRKVTKSLRRFCEMYFPGTFRLKWSPDHLKVIEKIERAVIEGGLFALAMPRGFGKTSLCEIAALWALMMGHHKFVALIGAELAGACDMLDSIKTELELNELLLGDFPEVCYPIVKLDGVHQRASGQICNGRSTKIGWTATELILPTVLRSRASGGIVRVAGVEGRIRGMKYKRPDGVAVRPSLVILDDPQTDESARSPMQVNNRLELLNGAILGLAGPDDKEISGIMPCTVIYPGDMADQILDRSIYPTWQGERTKMVYEFPKNTALWEEYVEIRNTDLVAGGTGMVATEFYTKNREVMDEGAVVAWPERFNPPKEISALQHAMNLLHRDKGGARAFWSEYQNQPLPPDGEIGATRIDKDMVVSKIVERERGLVPAGSTIITSFVDIHAEALYWMVCAWEENFTGTILNYGVWPKQPKEYFILSSIPRKMSDAVKGAGLEGRIYEGLRQIAIKILSKKWKVEGSGEVMSVARGLFDANWGQSTDVVYRFCRESALSALFFPSHGKYYGASSVPMSEARRVKGDRRGLNWRIPGRAAGRGTRHAVYDTNFWKSFVRDRFGTLHGDSGSLTLFHESGTRHELLFDHLASEFCVRTTGRGRTVEEWKIAGEQPDNHWLDCLVGCAVAASIEGAALFGGGDGRPVAAPRIKLSELKKQKDKEREKR